MVSQSYIEEKKKNKYFSNRYDLYKKRKKTMLSLNNSVFREYNQI